MLDDEDEQYVKKEILEIFRVIGKYGNYIPESALPAAPAARRCAKTAVFRGRRLRNLLHINKLRRANSAKFAGASGRIREDVKGGVRILRN